MPIAASRSAEQPNTVISSILKRWREIDRDTTSSIERTSDTGSALTWRSCSCTAALTEYGAVRVRTTHAIGVMRTFN